LRGLIFRPCCAGEAGYLARSESKRIWPDVPTTAGRLSQFDVVIETILTMAEAIENLMRS
jgi:hypothetical protein